MIRAQNCLLTYRQNKIEDSLEDVKKFCTKIYTIHIKIVSQMAATAVLTNRFYFLFFDKFSIFDKAVSLISVPTR